MSAARKLDGAALDAHPLSPVRDGDKDEHGRLLVIAGSTETPGSAMLTATAALRAGCGKVTLATVESVAPHVAMAVPQAKLLALPQAPDGGIARAAIAALGEDFGRFDAVVAGPGMKRSEACGDLAEHLLDAKIPRLVLDAALLYALPRRATGGGSATLPILLPHDREMAALLDCEPEEVNAEPLKCGLLCAERYQALTLVKGAEPLVVAPNRNAWRYHGGGPGLGVSGSGDILAGIAGGLLARGAEPLSALLWSVWLHGEAGAALARKNGPIGFLAHEIADEVPALLPR